MDKFSVKVFFFLLAALVPSCATAINIPIGSEVEVTLVSGGVVANDGAAVEYLFRVSDSKIKSLNGTINVPDKILYLRTMAQSLSSENQIVFRLVEIISYDNKDNVSYKKTNGWISGSNGRRGLDSQLTELPATEKDSENGRNAALINPTFPNQTLGIIREHLPYYQSDYIHKYNNSLKYSKIPVGIKARAIFSVDTML